MSTALLTFSASLYLNLYKGLIPLGPRNHFFYLVEYLNLYKGLIQNSLDLVIAFLLRYLNLYKGLILSAAKNDAPILSYLNLYKGLIHAPHHPLRKPLC